MSKLNSSASHASARTKRAFLGALVLLGVVALTNSNVFAETSEAPVASDYVGVQSALTLGSDYSCVITSTGGAKCWGYNGFGTLGNGNTTDSSTAVDVTGLTSGVASISAGGSHTCAVTTSGAAKCWGYNMEGNTGNGSSSLRETTPVDVVGLSSGVKTIVASNGDHTCALLATGGVKCWGLNSNGQLGTGNTQNSLTPVDVTGLTSGVSAISVGTYHSCALTNAGGVKCWGQNTYGELGLGNTTAAITSPQDVVGLTSGVIAISAGGPIGLGAAGWTCALLATGGVKCWGNNPHGLGALDGSNAAITFSVTPIDVQGLTSGVSAISVGESHACALMTSGGVKCWGSNIRPFGNSGQLGDGSFTSRETPVDVIGLGGTAIAVSTGNYHSCAILDSGALKCWGHNGSGQVGDGTTADKTSPTGVSGLGSGAGPSVTTTPTTVVTTTTPTSSGNATATTTKSRVQKADSLPETGSSNSLLVFAAITLALGGAVTMLRKRLL